MRGIAVKVLDPDLVSCRGDHSGALFLAAEPAGAAAEQRRTRPDVLQEER